MASSRCDYRTTVGTLHFAAGEASKSFSAPVVADGYAEGNETFTISLSGTAGAALGPINAATVTIIDGSRRINPVDDFTFFIRQQYMDFLGREPDPSGLQFYLDILSGCLPADIECVKYTRGALSTNFFRSPEFQRKGAYVMYLYMISLGHRPATDAELAAAGSNPFERPHYSEFVVDLQSISDPTDDPTAGERDFFRNLKPSSRLARSSPYRLLDPRLFLPDFAALREVGLLRARFFEAPPFHAAPPSLSGRVSPLASGSSRKSFALP